MSFPAIVLEYENDFTQAESNIINIKKNNMKTFNLIAAMAFILLLTSCGKNEPNFVGSFELTQQEVQCPSQSVTLDAGTHGICIPGADNNGETCLKWQLDINMDGTFSQRIIETIVFGNIIFSDPETYQGTYTTQDNQITFTETESSFELSIDELETTLAGYIGNTTENGCRFYSIFEKM